MITNAQKPAKFLGFDVSVRKSDAIKRDKNNVPARYYNGKIVLKVAIETVRNKLEEYSAIRYKVENGRQVWFAKFRGKLKDNDGEGCAKAVFELLCELDTAQRLKDLAIYLEDSGENVLALETERLWDTLCSMSRRRRSARPR